MRRARLRSGVELHYVEQGCGTPLVLVHGGTGDLQSWRPQLAEFARRYRVIAYSRRFSYPNRNGTIPADYSAKDDAEDLAALLELLEVNNACLVGTSYGALAALTLALEHPDALTRLVLAEPPVHRLAPRALYRRFLREVWQPAGRAFESGHRRQAMQTLVDGMWGRAVFARLPEPAVRAMMRNARSMQALVLSRDAFPDLPPRRLRRLKLPVLLVAGEHAAPIHRLANRALSRLLPLAETRTIAGASHGSPREHPALFNRLVLEFLAQP